MISKTEITSFAPEKSQESAFAASATANRLEAQIRQVAKLLASSANVITMFAIKTKMENPVAASIMEHATVNKVKNSPKIT